MAGRTLSGSAAELELYIPRLCSVLPARMRHSDLVSRDRGMRDRGTEAVPPEIVCISCPLSSACPCICLPCENCTPKAGSPACPSVPLLIPRSTRCALSNWEGGGAFWPEGF